MKTIKFFLPIGLFSLIGFHHQNDKLAIVKLPFNNVNEILCNYRLTYQPDSTSKVNKTEYFNLLSNGELSKFQSQSSHLRDSLTDLVLTSHQMSGSTNTILVKQLYALPQTSFRYMIYKRTGAENLEYYDWVGSKLYHYSENKQLLKWLITSATSVIAGYKCQQATTSFAGRKYEAWFTKEIPISDGPYKFYGLPGLIVKVQDVRKKYIFELVKLNQLKTSIPINLPAKPALTVTKAELCKGQSIYNLNLLNQAAIMGNKISVTDQQAYKQRMQKRNNPLELN